MGAKTLHGPPASARYIRAEPCHVRSAGLPLVATSRQHERAWRRAAYGGMRAVDRCRRLREHGSVHHKKQSETGELRAHGNSYQRHVPIISRRKVDRKPWAAALTPCEESRRGRASRFRG